MGVLMSDQYAPAREIWKGSFQAMVQSRWYKSGWTDERKAKQREAIQRWKPWEKSTGPRTERGKSEARANLAYARFKQATKDMTTRQLLALVKQI